MRHVWILAFMVLGCGPGVAPLVCARSDVDARCETPSSAVFDAVAGSWTVDLRFTETRSVEYEEAGHLCILTETLCRSATCVIHEDLGAIGEARAIDLCAESVPGLTA